jgi:hypothetical protein
MDRARLASLRCDPAAADELSSASDAERRTAAYWEVAIRTSAIGGTPDASAVSLYEILTDIPIESEAVDGMLNPLHQSDYPVPFGLDLWGYRRLPMAWPAPDVQLPQPAAGAARWLLEPVQAGRAAGVSACG